MARQWNPFEEGPLSIEERFTSQGRQRQDDVWSWYVTNEAVSCPFFDKSGRKIFHRHALNNRNEVSHRERLKETLKEYGFARGVRGNPWVISKQVQQPAGGDGSWIDSCEMLMMTSATLIEALYMAVDEYLAERGRKNINDLTEQEKAAFYSTQVGRSVQEGISGVTVFHERTPTDVLEWLRDFRNQFNKQASWASFIEHLVALQKIEPALSRHLESFEPPITSAHNDFEKTCKSFVDQKFPGRFSSYRELQSATAFRNRMVDYNLWSQFIDYCNQNVDFAVADSMDPGNIYKILNVASRKLLAYAARPSAPAGDSVAELHEYTWADLCMSVLKFAVPHAVQSDAEWTIPHLLAKPSDATKIEVLIAPMSQSKAAKLPETIKEAREKAAAKKTAKAKNKDGKKKAKAAPKRPAEILDTEEFASEMTDALGKVRLTLFGDDVLNSVNYTLEKVSHRLHKKDVVTRCLDLAILFGLDGSLDAAKMPKYTAWTRVRQHIKSVLNRQHSLQARLSDPDKPLPSIASGEKRSVEQDGEGHDADADEAIATKRVESAFKGFNEKTFSTFYEGNFGDLDQDGTELPKLSGVVDSHPGIMLTMNRVKKAVGSFCKSKSGKSQKDPDALLTFFIEEVAKVVCAVFEPSFVTVAVSLLDVCAGNDDMSQVPARLSSLPALTPYRKSIKAVVQAFQQSKSLAMTFIAHRTVYMLGGLQALDEVLKKAPMASEVHLQVVSEKVHKGLAILRQAVRQVSTMDLEVVEANCFNEGRESGEGKAMAFHTALATMWCRMVKAVSGAGLKDYSATRRSEQDWEFLEKKDAKEMANGKKTCKIIAKEVVESLPEHETALPGTFPAEVWKCCMEAKEAQDPEFRVNQLSSLKKELLARALVSLQVQAAKLSEEDNWKKWGDMVDSALSRCGGEDGEGEGPDGLSGIGAVGSLDATPFPTCVDNKHWQVQRVAAFATAFILSVHRANGIDNSCNSDIQGSGLLNFVDRSWDSLFVLKKKLCLGRALPDTEANLTSEELASFMTQCDGLRLCFAGRLVVVPAGQPVSSIKTKLKVASNYFSRLGFDVYVVPVTKVQNADMAIKSPLVAGAWLVKVREKNSTMAVAYENVSLPLPSWLGGGGDHVDLSLPMLKFTSSGDKATRMKSTSASGEEKHWLGFELVRSPTTTETEEHGDKAAQKKAKEDDKKRKLTAFEEQFEFEGFRDDAAHDQDNQITVPNAFLRHVLR